MRPKIDWNNHIINFVSVLLGVVVAFSLQSWNESLKEEKTIETALSNIANEVRKNMDRMDTVIKENQAQVVMQKEYLKLVDDEFNLQVSQEEWEEFASRYPDYYEQDEHSLTINFELFLLNRVSWETTNNMGIVSSMDFGLASNIATVYGLQQKVEQFDEEMVDKVSQLSGENTEPLEQILRSVQSRVLFAIALRDNGYPELLKELEAYE